jgi:glycosyltransferase A (GT-A) superfamily protein (DUF2064 family)
MMPHAKSNTQPTLVVFCKRPKLGQGKQRLAASIGAAKAFQIAVALLDCALEDAQGWEGPVVIAVASQIDKHWAASLLKRDVTVMVQPEGNLGIRLNTIDTRLREQGHGELVFIGTDAPILDHTIYQSVIKKLNTKDVVLSKADDGGVTIMANGAKWPDLEELGWSTHTLADDLANACHQKRLSLCYVAATYDIDVEADLYRLALELGKDSRLSRRQLVKQINNINPAAKQALSA